MPAKITLPDRLVNLQRRQLGLLTSRQVREAGVSQRVVVRLLRTGQWEGAARGVYRPRGTSGSWEQRALVACLVAGPDAVLSHGSAAAALGLDVPRRPRVLEVTIPVGRSGQAAGQVAVIHKSRRLDHLDRAKVGVLPVTGPARTLVDLAPRLSPRSLERLVDEVLCRKMVSREALLRRVLANSSRGRPGSGALRHALEAWSPGRPADSVAEMNLYRTLTAHGIPRPVRQYQIVWSGTVVAVLDLAWPWVRLGLEMDSERWRGSPRAVQRDRARALRLQAAGWDLVATSPAFASDGSLPYLLSVLRRRLGHSRSLSG